jgi:hypothetical protein
MFRRYNRWWSRFDQPDPYGGSYNLSNPQSFNRYAYGQNDPVNYVDPTGLESMPVGPCPPGNPCEVTVGLGGGFDASDGGPPEVTGVIIPREPIPFVGGQGPQDPFKPKPGTTINEILKAPLTPEEQEKIRKAKVYSDCFHNAMKGPNEELERLMYNQLRNTIVFSLGGKRVFGTLSLGRYFSPVSTILFGAHLGLQNWARELNEFDRRTYSPARKAADEKCRKEAGN